MSVFLFLFDWLYVIYVFNLQSLNMEGQEFNIRYINQLKFVIVGENQTLSGVFVEKNIFDLPSNISCFF